MMSDRGTDSCSEPSGLSGLRSAAGPATRPRNDDVVPREALAQSKRRYYSPARRKRAGATREVLLDAAVELIVAGNFRPEASAIAARAKVHPATINRHFLAIHLLYRVIARERTGAVLEALGLFPIDVPRLAALQTDLVWISLTGRRRDGWG